MVHLQVDPAGKVLFHPPLPQLHHTPHLLHQRLVLPPSNLVLLLSHKEEEESFTQSEEGREVLHRQLGLESWKQIHVIPLISSDDYLCTTKGCNTNRLLQVEKCRGNRLKHV